MTETPALTPPLSGWSAHARGLLGLAVQHVEVVLVVHRERQRTQAQLIDDLLDVLPRIRAHFVDVVLPQHEPIRQGPMIELQERAEADS